ncbi:AraC family transcriptional regulator [Clostridium lacusfryxellense]|uniref:AraC family transcriptional regulator n=1 Tax=Clostridium lacusfryxellense TaxID=205328 RepID=UPI001C0CF4CB|nr:AraC family transcriptional regulator [Clostridium lacusfryxellense]MBU3113260.1 AraC family transcriptional regulator [Clostridium lacusfryxellense]
MQIIKENIKLDSTFPLKIHTAIIEPDHLESPIFHWHDCIEISYVKKGRGFYVVNGKKYIMEPGDVIIVNSLEPHCWEVFPPENMIQPVLLFSSSLIWSGETNIFDYQYLEPFSKKITNFSNKLPHNNPATKNIFDLLISMSIEYENKQIGYKLMLKAKLLEIITTLIRHFQDNTKAFEDVHIKQGKIERLNSTLEFINSNYINDIRLAQGASIACMSISYFSTFFSNTLGLSFKEYIIRLRINHALELINTTHKSITEIAMESGFNNLSNYYKAYKKYYTLSK